MAAQVIRHHAELFGEIAIDLAHPRQMALGETVDEQDFRARRVAPFLRRNSQSVWRLHADRLVFQLLSKARLRDRGKKSGGDRQLSEPATPECYRHGQSSYVRVTGEPRLARFDIPPYS